MTDESSAEILSELRPEGQESAKKKETTSKFKEIAAEIQDTLSDIYGLEDQEMERAEDFIWEESDEELKKLLRVDQLHPRGVIYSIYKNKRDEYVGTILYMPPKTREALATSTDESRLKGEHLDDHLTLIEEVSHFVYRQYYFNKHGAEPIAL